MAIAKEQLRQIITENDINNVGDIYAFFKDSFKDMLQELLEAEMDCSLGYKKNNKQDILIENKRNGHSPKTVKSQYGEFQVDIPRDRAGEFEPQIIPKYQRDISGIEEKIISLYARGMSTRDIHDQLQDLYGIELSTDILSITIGANESSKFWLSMLNDLRNRGVKEVLFFKRSAVLQKKCCSSVLMGFQALKKL